MGLRQDHATVDAFYNAAIEAGSTDNGKPGLRPQYHPNYYAAFVVDPLGNNFELVGFYALFFFQFPPSAEDTTALCLEPCTKI
jgi:hypothetical protein